jgi:hypothetical protein
MKHKLTIITSLILLAILGSSCAADSSPAAPTIDINDALTQAVATIYAEASLTQQAIPTATSTPEPSPTALRTPPALPASFTTDLLNPIDAPKSYINDSCEYLKAKWSSGNAAPGTVVMTIMFHSITDGEVTNPDQISMGDFRKLMNDLNDQGFEAIDMTQMEGFMYRNAYIPPRSVLLIVDDRKYRAYFDKAFAQYHEDWGWKVVNAWINADDSIYQQALPENVALENEGWVDHQSHGYIHNLPMSNDSTDAYLKGELLGSREKMQRDFGKTPRAIIWPGGGFDLRPIQAAREYGYKLGFTINPRGPVMFNWVPQSDQSDPMRPSFISEGSINDPLMTLPRYWDTDARSHLDTVRQIQKSAAAYEMQNKDTELLYYDIMCVAAYGAMP